VLSQGAIGMSLFFVLSGFVLTYRYYDTTDFDRYRVHRVSRIVPVYLFAALITLPWLVGALDHPTPAIGALRYALLALLDLTFMQAWFPQTFDYWNNGASWSISVEAFFYALFPLILVRLRQFKDGDLAKVCAIAWVLAVLPGATYALLPQKPSFTLFYTMPIFRLPEFIVGMVAGLCFMRGRVVLKYPDHGNRRRRCRVAGLPRHLGKGPADLRLRRHNWIAVPVIAITILASAQLSSGWLYRRALSSGARLPRPYQLLVLLGAGIRAVHAHRSSPGHRDGAAVPRKPAAVRDVRPVRAACTLDALLSRRRGACATIHFGQVREDAPATEAA
jgi:hypothetical protein